MDKFSRINGWLSKNSNDGAIPRAVSPGSMQSTTAVPAGTHGKHMSTISSNDYDPEPALDPKEQPLPEISGTIEILAVKITNYLFQAKLDRDILDRSLRAVLPRDEHSRRLQNLDHNMETSKRTLRSLKRLLDEIVVREHELRLLHTPAKEPGQVTTLHVHTFKNAMNTALAVKRTSAPSEVSLTPTPRVPELRTSQYSATSSIDARPTHPFDTISPRGQRVDRSIHASRWAPRPLDAPPSAPLAPAPVRVQANVHWTADTKRGAPTRLSMSRTAAAEHIQSTASPASLSRRNAITSTILSSGTAGHSALERELIPNTASAPRYSNGSRVPNRAEQRAHRNPTTKPDRPVVSQGRTAGRTKLRPTAQGLRSSSQHR